MVKKILFFIFKSIAGYIISRSIMEVLHMNNIYPEKTLANYFNIDLDLAFWLIILVTAIIALFFEYWLPSFIKRIRKQKKNPHFTKTLEVISQCHRILKNELVDLSHNNNLVQQYRDEFDKKFKGLFDITEISDDKKLFQLIQNAENRFKVILGMANSIVHDSERIERPERVNLGSITTVHRFNQESKAIIDQFIEEKESIFKYCK